MLNLNYENITKLTFSKDVFLDYSKGIEEMFTGPSFYFYDKTMNMLKENEYESLFDNNSYIESLYSTLASWGMHRMDKNTRMAEYDKFRQSIIDNKTNLIPLSKSKLRDMDIESIKEQLLVIFRSLKIMAREDAPKFVAHSKIMHFLLPSLIPPMDKGHILYFLYGGDRITEKGKKAKKNLSIKDEEQMFIDVLKQFQIIANKLDLKEEDLKNKWDASIPKIIDNAIIGYNRNKKMEISR